MLNIENPFIKYICIISIIILINITVHQSCLYIGCGHWTTSFGHNILCNYCIDYLKAVKDYQFILYGTLITTVTSRINQIVERVKSGVEKDK